MYLFPFLIYPVTLAPTSITSQRERPGRTEKVFVWRLHVLECACISSHSTKTCPLRSSVKWAG